MTTPPLFSIVMPVLNRQTEVRRAIDSCLAQEFDRFEIVVVDGASTDGTPEAVAGYHDPRVRLIVDRVNRGTSPARNTAVRASLGEWVIFVDSDHELLPGSLSQIERHVAAAEDSVARLGFQYLFDDGRITPSPFPPEVVGYGEWLRWIDQVQWTQTDVLWVTRRACFSQCRLPESFATEFSYFLDFAKNFQSRMVPLTLAFQHTDSPNRLSYRASSPDPEVAKRKAQEQADNWRYVLGEHGAALQEFAPRRYQDVLRGAALSSLAAGNRASAMQASLAGLRFRLRSVYGWATLLLVLAGPHAALLLSRWRAKRRRRESARTAGTVPCGLARSEVRP